MIMSKILSKKVQESNATLNVSLTASNQNMPGPGPGPPGSFDNRPRGSFLGILTPGQSQAFQNNVIRPGPGPTASGGDSVAVLFFGFEYVNFSRGLKMFEKSSKNVVFNKL